MTIKKGDRVKSSNNTFGDGVDRIGIAQENDDGDEVLVRFPSLEVGHSGRSGIEGNREHWWVVLSDIEKLSPKNIKWI